MFQIHLGGLRVSATSGKFDYFYSYLSLETVSPALKLTQNCYINVNIFFLKTSNLFLNWVPSLFSYNHLIPDRLSLESILPNSLVNGEQIESTTWAYVKKKKKNLSFFSWFGKNWEVPPEQPSKIRKSLCELRKTWKFSQRLTLKITILNLRMNWEKLGPNISFTVKNKARNLHKIKLFLFQTQWMRYSITSNFETLSMNWEKYVFYWEK